jgi:3'(2'), 5'-bisphosphate nucleotidase
LHRAGIGASDSQICEWIDHGNANAYANRFWTLDPIDGTKGFLRREQYAVSLALIVDGQIVVAVLGCPNLSVDPSTEQPAGLILSAVKGSGSYSMPLDAKPVETKIRVSATADSSAARFCESVESGHSAHDISARVSQNLGITVSPARLDSQAKYAVVARGEADIYMRLPANATYREKIWDHAGGVLIVEEAGGRVTDVMGKPLEFTHGRQLEANRGIIATNGKLHDQVLAALHKEYAAKP